VPERVDDNQRIEPLRMPAKEFFVERVAIQVNVEKKRNMACDGDGFKNGRTAVEWNPDDGFRAEVQNFQDQVKAFSSASEELAMVQREEMLDLRTPGAIFSKPGPAGPQQILSRVLTVEPGNRFPEGPCVCGHSCGPDCLGAHSHSAGEATTAKFGPNISLPLDKCQSSRESK